MIYGKLWLVVRPTVGIPLFLGAVAIGSFSVHYMLVTNTTWVKKFLDGKAAVTAMADAPATTAAAAPPTAKQ
jgi:light-harvesting protein B-800-850 alpha chain